MTIKTGFIGLGNQGGAIAERMLAQGVKVAVWARRPETMGPFVEKGATTAASPAALGREQRVVGVCVGDDNDVRSVVLGDNGVLAGMARGGLILIHSTVAPATVIELEKLAAEKGVRLLDAPVSGGARGALAGTMTVMVGGDADVLEEARPQLETFAASIPHLGAVGSGQGLKLLNNALCYGNAVMGVIALETAEKLGMDRKIAGDIMAISSGQSNGLSLVVDEDRLRHFSTSSAPGKDVRLFLDALKGAGLPDNELATAVSTLTERIRSYAERVLDN